MARDYAIADIDHITWSADALERLDQLAGARDYIDWLMDQAVTECRTNALVPTVDLVGDETRHRLRPQPISWAKIAEILGVSRQTAWQKYRHLEDS